MTSRIKNYRLSKDGKKLMPSVKHLPKNKQIAARKSKKVKVGKPTVREHLEEIAHRYADVIRSLAKK